MVVLAIAALSYAARLLGDAGAAVPDLFFRWSTAITTFALDGVLLLLVLLIARGLSLREALALRAPCSWRDAWSVAAAGLVAIYTVSFVEELVIGHASREQAVPQFWDPSRAGAFAANVVIVALIVPIVEETLCRGLGFRLLEPYGRAVAIVGTAVAFALAHGAITDLPWVLATGLALGYLRSRSGSLYPGVALHAVVNGIAIVASAALAASG